MTGPRLKKTHPTPNWFVREEYTALYRLPAAELVEQIARRTAVLKAFSVNREIVQEWNKVHRLFRPCALEDGVFLEDRQSGPRLPIRDPVQQMLRTWAIR